MLPDAILNSIGIANGTSALITTATVFTTIILSVVLASSLRNFRRVSATKVTPLVTNPSLVRSEDGGDKDRGDGGHRTEVETADDRGISRWDAPREGFKPWQAANGYKGDEGGGHVRKSRVDLEASLDLQGSFEELDKGSNSMILEGESAPQPLDGISSGAVGEGLLLALRHELMLLQGEVVALKDRDKSREKEFDRLRSKLNEFEGIWGWDKPF